MKVAMRSLIAVLSLLAAMSAVAVDTKPFDPATFAAWEAAAVELGSGSYALGFLAGVLTILSPCVLPLLPIIVGTALAAHPFGAVALALGLALSFTGVGLFVATVGFAVGLDTEWFRT